MNAEFQWWLLIVGLVVGGGLVYLVLADLRADADLVDGEDLGDDQEPAMEQEPGDAPGSVSGRLDGPNPDDSPDVERDRP